MFELKPLSKEGLAAALEQDYQQVIVDVGLPDGDGLSTARSRSSSSATTALTPTRPNRPAQTIDAVVPAHIVADQHATSWVCVVRCGANK